MKEPFAHLEPKMTFQEIADELGMTRAGAFNLYKSGMKKLRTRSVLRGFYRMHLQAQSARRYGVSKGRSKAAY